LLTAEHYPGFIEAASSYSPPKFSSLSLTWVRK
jgi:hypothetical protein